LAPALLSVAGATSRAGKTALAEACLALLPRHSTIAVKFTTTEDVFERCPRGSSCTVCDLDRPWRLVEEPAVLGVPGTDTERLARAGARRVIWAIARRSAAKEAWAEVAARLGDAPVVMEGSSVTAHVQPRIRLFVVHARLDPERWKPGSLERMGRADVVILNGADEPTRAVREAVRAARGGEDPILADVRCPLADWAPRLADRIRAELPAAAAAPRPVAPEPARTALESP
jgi:hypothetical protein